MFNDAATELKLDEVATILDQVNPLLEGSTYDPIETSILSSDIPFYHGYQLLEISDQTTHPVRKHTIIYAHNDAHIVNFTSEGVAELNRKLALNLDEQSVYDYVRFFFNYVSGKHGRFLIVENIDDIAWKENPPPNARKAIAKMIEPIKSKDTDQKDTFCVSAHMIFKNGLFRSDIAVSKDGTVNMSNEELLIEDMPIIDDAIGQ